MMCIAGHAVFQCSVLVIVASILHDIRLLIKGVFLLIVTFATILGQDLQNADLTVVAQCEFVSFGFDR